MRAHKGRKDLLMPHWLPSDENWPCIYIGGHHLSEPLPVSPHLGSYLQPCERGGDCFTAEEIKVLRRTGVGPCKAPQLGEDAISEGREQLWEGGGGSLGDR